MNTALGLAVVVQRCIAFVVAKHTEHAMHYCQQNGHLLRVCMLRICCLALLFVVGWYSAVQAQTATPHARPRVTTVQQLPLAYIETTRDGVAQLLVSKLLGVAPMLRNLPSDGLHLLRKGHFIPVALVDHDGRLTDDDTLLFVGSHPTGDTTYFDAYTDRAAFEVWYDPSQPPYRLQLDTATGEGLPLRRHIVVERHIEYDREYVQGWLDNDRYSQTQSTFVTETVPGEGWAWAITYPLRPFSTFLPVAPDPSSDDSIEVKIVYSAISDDIFTAPDHRLQCRYGGILRDSTTFDGPRYDTLGFVLRPRRDGCIVDSLVFQNTATTIAAEAVDYITTRGTERAVATGDYLAGRCQSTQDEELELLNFVSSRALVFDTLRRTWRWTTGERGVLFRLSARQSPQRLGIAIGDTAIVTTRQPITVAWLDEQQTVQLFSENAPTVAGLIRALPVGTPFAILIADGQTLDQTLRDQLTSEGSSSVSAITSGVAYVGCGVRGQPLQYQEALASGAAVLIAWVPTERGNAYRVVVPLSRGDHALVATGSTAIEHARIRPCGGSDLYADTNRADYVIITHRFFRAAAERLARYRSQHHHVRARVVEVQDIFDAFGRGEKSPHAIKAFLRYAYRQWGAPPPRAILLMGDASWDPRRVSPTTINEDFIPSYGKPVSDFWYTLLEGDDYIPEMSIGRLPVTTLVQAEAIVDKLIEYDTLPPARWHKRFLFITGGADPAEQVDFYESVVYSLLPLLVDPYQRALCADTVLASFYAGTADASPVPTAIVNTINSGAVWVNYIGHGAPRTLEVAGWEPERLRNRGRYPILASFSCQIGAFAEPAIQALGEDFLAAPSAGMVAVIATTGFGIRSYDDIVNAGIFASLARSTSRALGDVLNRAKLYLFDGTQLAINTILQTTLLGDPLTRIPIDTLPHPVLDGSSLTIRSVPDAPTLTTNAESAIVEVMAFNAGVYADSTIEVRLVRTYQLQRDTFRTVLSQLCYPVRLRFVLPIHNMPGSHALRIEIDTVGRSGPMAQLDIPLYVYAEQLYPVEPQAGWNIAPTDTIVRFLNPFATAAPFTYEALLLSDRGDTLATSAEYPVNVLPTHCQWHFPPLLTVGREYRIVIRGYNTERQVWTPPLIIPIVITEQAAVNRIDHVQGVGGGAWSRSIVSGMEQTPSGTLTFAQSIGVELLSAGGYQFDQRDSVRLPIQPAYRLRIGGVNVASERNDEIGVHLAVLSPYTGAVKAVRWYATWTTTPINRSNGGAPELIEFLRDSVADRDYVLLTSCGGAWALQFRQYAAAFRTVLAEFGAQYADSLNATRSYLFVGMRSGNRPFMLERLGIDDATQGSDTISAVFELPIFPLEAQLVLPPAGPAEQWKSARLDVSLTTARLQLAAYGSKAPNDQTQIVASSDSSFLSLADLDAAEYPYLQIVCTLQRDSTDFTPCTIASALVEYTPLPEIAAALDVGDRSPLRGDSVAIRARVINLVSRSGVRLMTGQWQVIGVGGEAITSETLPAEFTVGLGDTTLNALLPTLDLPDAVTLQLTLVPQRDQYQFNNFSSQMLRIRSDSDPPRVLLLANGVPAGDTTIVAQHVLLECALLDSARVAITDSTAIVLRLNGLRLPQGTQPYTFFPTSALPQSERWSAEPLARAAVSTAVELEQGVNILLVTARDATGNTTTAQFVLVVPSSLWIDSVAVSPNPCAVGQEAVVTAIYHGFEQSAPARLEVFDVLGKKVYGAAVTVVNGINHIAFPLIDQSSGGSLQSGAYYWRLWLEPLGATDAVGGVLIVLQ